MTAHNLTPQQRFDRFVLKGKGCWLWVGAKDPSGYGRFRVGGKNGASVYAHRFAYETSVGPTGDLFVMHSCDTPACVRPDHLLLGSARDNFDDMIRKGRQNFSGLRYRHC